MGEENLVPTKIRSSDRLASGESLYRLSYRGSSLCLNLVAICTPVFLNCCGNPGIISIRAFFYAKLAFVSECPVI
jgi:hypothetical protein